MLSLAQGTYREHRPALLISPAHCSFVGWLTHGCSTKSHQNPVVLGMTNQPGRYMALKYEQAGINAAEQ